MSLRVRLALVLAAVMVGPLVAASVAVGVLVPQVRAAAADASLRRAVASTTAALAEQCLATGEAARAAALELSAVVTGGRAIDAGAARLAAEHAVQRRPDLTAAVLTPGGGATPGVLATAGPAALRLDLPAVVAADRASCARRQAPAGGSPALTESVPVLDPQGREVARTVAVRPLDDAALRGLVTGLDLGAEVAVVTGGSVVAASGPPGAQLRDLAGRAATADRTGELASDRYRLEPFAAGLPYTVLAWSGTGDPGLLRTVALVLSVSLLLCVAALALLTSRLTRPLVALTGTARRLGGGDLSARSGITGRDEVGTLAASFDRMAADLQATIEELRASRDTLADTFSRFGEALGHTHDLDGLVRTVLEAARRGTGSSAGTAVLVDTHGVADPLTSVADGESEASAPVVAKLEGLARDALAGGRPLMVAEALPVGPALAVPLRRGTRTVGAVAVARRRGEPLFEERAVDAVAALAEHAGTAVVNVREHEETRRLSVTDPLTGAGNFRHLSTTLSREVERATRFERPLSVLMLDLDHFKQVNDGHGHAFGDAVLREVAGRLVECLREVDTVARYGGEEFAVVLPETGPDGAVAVAARIVQAVREQPFTALGSTMSVSVSVGVAAFPEHGRTASELLRVADAALYEAKDAGRDRWHVAPTPVPQPRAEPAPR